MAVVAVGSKPHGEEPVTDYKLLALDLDGTLLRRDGTIHEDDLAAIKRLQEAGVPVTIVTGRLYSGSREAARCAGVLGPVACVDGSQIVDTRDDTGLFHHAIVGDHAALVRGVLERHTAACFLFAEDSIVHDEAGAPFAPYVRTWSPDIAVVERVTSHPYWEHERGILAVVAVGTETSIVAAATELRAQLGEVAMVASFSVSHDKSTFAMLVRAAGASKGTAVQWLATHHGCSTAEVVVVGDWLNDLPMFEAAGRSFVMKQAPEHVKEAATDRLEADAAGRWRGRGNRPRVSSLAAVRARDTPRTRREQTLDLTQHLSHVEWLG